MMPVIDPTNIPELTKLAATLFRGRDGAVPVIEAAIESMIRRVVDSNQQPTAPEFLRMAEEIDAKARWSIVDVVKKLANPAAGLTEARRDYLDWLLNDECLPTALRGENASDRELISSIDQLIRASHRYRTRANKRKAQS